MMEDLTVESSLQDWKELEDEFKTLEALNREYQSKLEEVGELQAKCMKEINHQKYRMGMLSKNIPIIRKKSIGDSDLVSLEDLEKNIMKRKALIFNIEQTLPKENGMYLKIILGNVNVSILNKNDKFKYKDEYEKFKLVLSVIGFFLAIINLLKPNFRPLELIYIFLLVWYYCTLTIRESILKVNGSRIKGWWRAHHFISTVAAGILLIWPGDTEAWASFRNQFMIFNGYISTVQYLQFRYQQGVLYRLKALGERHNMDITIEGFHSWMWRGLSFLLPFLFFGYLFQLYNAYVLWNLSYLDSATWHVPVLCGMFLILFLGNSITTCMVIPQKLQERVMLKYRLMSQRLSWAKNLNHQGDDKKHKDEKKAKEN